MKVKLGFTAILTLIIGLNCYSQCKGFTKRRCLPSLAPYQSNGQLHSAQINPDEEAEILLNFNKGFSYRIIVCSDPYLENLNYQLFDQNEFEIYADTVKGYVSTNDIKVSETQNMKMLLKSPKKNNATGIKRSGCVTVLIGFKE